MDDTPQQIAALFAEEESRLVARPRRQRGHGQNSFPLSFAQQRIWLLEQFEPGGAVYNIAEVLRLSGHLRVEALEQALGEIIRRHETLRTTFASVDGEAVQVVHPPYPPRLPLTDLSQLFGAQREAAVREH